jgi:hypothetical protein
MPTSAGPRSVRIGPHIDVRADGGYVIGDGSRIGERPYTARDERVPVPLPPWIADLLTDKPPTVDGLQTRVPRGGAQVIAWRIDAFLDGNPGPPQPVGISPESALPTGGSMRAPACPAYESAGEALERLTALTIATIGGELAERAQAEVAWPALIVALRRAENAGFDPADALTRTATARELRTARNVSEVLAWRINRHLAVHSATSADAGTTPNDTAMTTTNAPNTTTQSTIPADEQDHASAREVAASGPVAAPLLPWVPGPRQDPTDDEATPLTAYLGDAAALITARAADLADTAIRLRPPWTSALGQQPADPDRACEWRRHVGVIAAYRDQHKVATDDPGRFSAPTPRPAAPGTGPTGTPPNPSSPPAGSSASSRWKPNSRGADDRDRAGLSACTVQVRNARRGPMTGHSSRFRPGPLRRPAAGFRSVKELGRVVNRPGDSCVT